MQQTDDYQLLHDAYKGTGGFKDGGYLVQFRREDAQNFENRKKLAYYLNYVKPVLDSHVNPLFEKVPTRDWNPDPKFDLFVDNVDNNKTSLDAFMKKAARSAKLHGVAFIVCDNFTEQQQPSSEKEAVDNRIFPYLYLVKKNRVKEAEVDQFGRLIFISYTENHKNSEGKKVIWTKEWTPTQWVLKDEKGEEQDSGIHGLGVVPVIPIFSGEPEDGEMLPQSEFYHIARTNLRIYNNCSEIAELLRQQAFSIFIYPETDKGKLTEVVVGPNNALTFDGVNSRHPPAFIAPSAEPVTLLFEELAKLVQEIYRMAMLSHVTGVQKQTSGESKKWDFKQTSTALSDFALSVQEAEGKIAIIFELWTGVNLNYQVKYADDYSIQEVEQEIREAMLALDTGIGGRFDLEIKKKLVAVIFKDLPSERYDAIMEELDEKYTDQLKSVDGADVTAALQVLQAVSAKQISKEAAIQMLVVFYGLEEEKAVVMVNSIEEQELPESTP